MQSLYGLDTMILAQSAAVAVAAVGDSDAGGPHSRKRMRSNTCDTPFSVKPEPSESSFIDVS